MVDYLGHTLPHPSIACRSTFAPGQRAGSAAVRGQGSGRGPDCDILAPDLRSLGGSAPANG